MSGEFVVVLMVSFLMGVFAAQDWWQYVTKRFAGGRRLVMRIVTLPVMVLAIAVSLGFFATMALIEERQRINRCWEYGPCGND